MNSFKEEAKNSFFKREYKKALLHFSLALKEYPNDIEAKIGALLADMASEHEEEAVALFEYYEITKAENKEDADLIMEDIIEAVDESSEKILSSLQTNSLEYFLQYEDGIQYEDFIKVVDNRGSFKRAFEDIMFSTKVIISTKEDFENFLERLIENDFDDIAYNYLETAMVLYPNEGFFQTLLKKKERYN